MAVEDSYFFVYGFAKNDRANIERYELEAFRQLVALFNSYTNLQLDEAVQNGALTELICNEQNVQE
jgi:hypothetical protein